MDVRRREDQLLDKISDLTRSRDHALKLIKQFTLADNTLWPVLAEIELTLMRTKDERRH